MSQTEMPAPTRVTHIVLGVYHLASALAITILAAGSAEVLPVITRSEPSWQNGTVVGTTTHIVGDLNLGELAGAFGWISGLSHVWIGYFKHPPIIDSGFSVIRWLDYCVSLPTMQVVLCLMAGIGDLYLLLTVAAVSMAAMTGALGVEVIVQPQKPVSDRYQLHAAHILYFFSAVAYGISWAPILGAVGYGGVPTDSWLAIMVSGLLMLPFPGILYCYTIGDRAEGPAGYVNLDALDTAGDALNTASRWLTIGPIFSFSGKVFSKANELLGRVGVSIENENEAYDIAFSSASCISKLSLHWMLWVAVLSREEGATPGPIDTTLLSGPGVEWIFLIPFITAIGVYITVRIIYGLVTA